MAIKNIQQRYRRQFFMAKHRPIQAPIDNNKKVYGHE